MKEGTINQRLKFLIERLSTSVRSFSEAIGESSSNTNNYIGSKQTEPKSEYLSKVVSHFSNVNAHWLLTGEGEPFIGGTPATNINQSQSKTKGSTVVGTNNGDVVTNIDECRKERDSYKLEVERLQQQVASQAQLLDAKDQVIAAKDLSLLLLKGKFDRPN